MKSYEDSELWAKHLKHLLVCIKVDLLKSRNSKSCVTNKSLISVLENKLMTACRGPLFDCIVPKCAIV